MDVFSKINSFVQEKIIITPGQRVIAAVSGGMDSMLMLEYFYKNRAVLGIDLGVLHIDHGLHPLSDKHARFVEIQAHRRGLPVFIERITWRGGHPPATDIEQKARHERLKIFQRIARRWRADVATAHHKTDQAETVLMRLLRGTGLKGIAAMRPVSVCGKIRILRPCLSLTKEEIKHAVQTLKIPYRRDPTNQDSRFVRNRLRRLMDRLRHQINPALDEVLSRFADQAAQDDEALQQWAQSVYATAVRDSTQSSLRMASDALAGIPPAVVKRVFHFAYEHITGHRRRLEARHLEALMALLSARTGCEKLPYGIVVEKKGSTFLWRQI